MKKVKLIVIVIVITSIKVVATSNGFYIDAFAFFMKRK